MAFGGGGDRKALSEINVTPMVDVMLVLLIIFMVTAPLIQTGVKVELPQAKTPPVKAEAAKLVLAVTKDKRIFIADTEVPLESLGVKLAANAKVKSDKELYLHADRSLSYGFVMEIMAIAKQSGVESLGMITDPPDVTK